MKRRFSYTVVTIIVFIVGAGWSQTSQAIATVLPNRFDQLSNSATATAATNLIGFQITDLTHLLGSIQFQFCANDPLIADPCTAPTGFDASGAVLANQTGNTGFTISPASTANNVILTRTAVLPVPDIGNPLVSTSSYQLDNVINPSTLGSYYLRLEIFPTTDVSGPDTQEGGVALSTTSNINVNATVPKMLFFCSALSITNNNCATAQGNSINFGNFSRNSTVSGTSQFTVGTNANSGYGVTVNGTTLTAGNSVIPGLASPSPSVTGVSQFGFNLRANSIPSVGSDVTGGGSASAATNYNTPNRYTFNNNDVIVSTNTVSNYQTFTISYITNVNSSQAPGVYVTTLSYICLANF